MKVINQTLQKNGKMDVEFSDADLVMIAKYYADLTKKKRDPTKLTQAQINKVIQHILNIEIKKIQEARQ